MIEISILIPTYNRPEALRRCLEALSAQTYDAEGFEIVVCDDGSPPEVAQQLADICSQVRLIQSTHSGPAGARNKAAAAAQGRYLVFLDDDCIADPDWLAQLAPALTPGTLVAGHIKNGFPDNLPSEVGELILEVGLRSFAPGPSGLYFFRSTNLAIAAADFWSLGGWDESFRTSEDREFCRRWQEQGGRMHQISSAVVWHYSFLTTPGFVRRHFSYGRGAYRFHRQKTLRTTADLGTLRYYARVLRAIYRHNGLSLRAGALFVFWQLANLAGFSWEAVCCELAPKLGHNAPRCKPPDPAASADATDAHCDGNRA